MGRGRGGRGRAIISVDDVIVGGVSIAENEAITIGHQKAEQTKDGEKLDEKNSENKKDDGKGQGDERRGRGRGRAHSSREKRLKR